MAIRAVEGKKKSQLCSFFLAISFFLGGAKPIEFKKKEESSASNPIPFFFFKLLSFYVDPNEAMMNWFDWSIRAELIELDRSIRWKSILGLDSLLEKNFHLIQFDRFLNPFDAIIFF